MDDGWVIIFSCVHHMKAIFIRVSCGFLFCLFVYLLLIFCFFLFFFDIIGISQNL